MFRNNRLTHHLGIMSTLFVLSHHYGPHCNSNICILLILRSSCDCSVGQNFKSQSFVTTFLCLKLCLRVPETKHLLSLLRLCSSVTVLNYRIVTFFYGMSLIKIITIELETIFRYVGKLQIYNILVHNIFCNINCVQLVNYVSTCNTKWKCILSIASRQRSIQKCVLFAENLLFDR